MLKNIPTSVFKRSWLLGKTFGGMVLRAGLVKSFNTMGLNEKDARMMVDTLSRLKGAALKWGQMLSLDHGSYFPEPVRKMLEALQNATEPVEHEKMMVYAKRQIGKDMFEQISSITPHASASLGQVYRAQLKDKEVALKILYPGVSKTLKSDWLILKWATKTLLQASGKSVPIDHILKDLKHTLLRECDLKYEAQMLGRFQNLLKNDSRYQVPSVIKDYSSTGILTMTWCQGPTLTEWLRSKPQQADRQIIAESLTDLFLKEFWSFQLMQTDPNPANFIVNPQTLTLGLIDFGSTFEFSDQFVNRYRSLLKKVFKFANDEELVQALQDLSLLDSRESDEVKSIMLRLLKMSTAPLLVKGQILDFAQSDLLETSQPLIWRLTQKSKYSAAPHEIMMLHRKLGGVFQILTKLEVKVDWASFWQKYIF